ncbi:MAG: hypothetical protein ACJ790_11770, partial [Myxococcaceae bacterium]
MPELGSLYPIWRAREIVERLPRIAFFAASNGFAIFGASDVYTFASGSNIELTTEPRSFRVGGPFDRSHRRVRPPLRPAPFFAAAARAGVLRPERPFAEVRRGEAFRAPARFAAPPRA